MPLELRWQSGCRSVLADYHLRLRSTYYTTAVTARVMHGADVEPGPRVANAGLHLSAYVPAALSFVPPRNPDWKIYPLLLQPPLWKSANRTDDIRPTSIWLATDDASHYSVAMLDSASPLTSDELRRRLLPFCEKHPIRRLEVFGSAATGKAAPGSDVDLLVTLEETTTVSTDELLEMAGEAEELIGRRVDFVLRSSLEKSSNRYAREHILATALCLYGD